jgi:murein DD-endopeptidase MepM/ murein hydrolase activator NlpD
MKKKTLIIIIVCLTLALIATFTFLIVDIYRNHGQMTTETIDDAPEWIPIERYGIVVDTLEMYEDVVKKGETLSTLLTKSGLSVNIYEKIYSNCKNIFDVKKIKEGQPYIILKSADSLSVPLYFVYENSKIQYTVFELFEPFKVYQKENEVTYLQDTISGTITSSLWNAIVNGKGDPVLATAMADVYQWTIDFFGIQLGDEFHVIYTKKYVNQEYIGLDNIESALFKHNGKNFYAFYYQKDSTAKGEYFDENGESLRRAFLKAPLNYNRISSRFSNNRYHPVLKIYRPHHGVDYAAPSGTPVYSIGNGKVIGKGYEPGGGNYIKIKHNSVYTTVYMHLKGFATGIKQGAAVSQGQLIGYVGNTGLATGPHLDFRVYKNNTPIDPLSMQSPPAEPIAKENMLPYKQYIQPIQQGLNNLTIR